jgi:hypothetical protein
MLISYWKKLRKFTARVLSAARVPALLLLSAARLRALPNTRVD